MRGRLHCLSAVLLTGLILSNAAVADDMSDLIAALRAAATAGDADAQVELGRRYFDGDGIRPDSAAARAWFFRAANQKAPRAFYYLGEMRRTGRGAPFDVGYAFILFRRAAKAGVPEAAHRVGLMYRDGIGIESDLRQARHWLGVAVGGGIGAAEAERRAVADKIGEEPP